MSKRFKRISPTPLPPPPGTTAVLTCRKCKVSLNVTWKGQKLARAVHVEGSFVHKGKEKCGGTLDVRPVTEDVPPVLSPRERANFRVTCGDCGMEWFYEKAGKRVRAMLSPGNKFTHTKCPKGKRVGQIQGMKIHK